MTADRSPPASPPGSLARSNRASTNTSITRTGLLSSKKYRGTRAIASIAHDPPPQRSASFQPPANRAGIISRESHQAQRFHTARVNRLCSNSDQSRKRRVRRPDARRFRTTRAGPCHRRSPPEWLSQAAGDSWQNWACAVRSSHSRNTCRGRRDGNRRLARRVRRLPGRRARVAPLRVGVYGLVGPASRPRKSGPGLSSGSGRSLRTKLNRQP